MREYNGDIAYVLYALKLKPSNIVSKSFLLRN